MIGPIKKGATDQTVYLFVQDSTSTSGAGKTGIAYNASGLKAYYVRPLGNSAQLTLATQTVTGAHSDGGWVEVDSTNMPGIYRLDLSDAVVASGADYAILHVFGATGMAPVSARIALVAYDPQSATDLGLSRLDAAISSRSTLSAANVWSEALPGSYTSGQAGKLVGDNINATISSRATQTSVDTIDDFLDTEIAAIKTKTDNLPASPAATGDIPSAATIADAVWDETLSGHLTAGSTGNALNAAGSAGDPWSTALPGAYGSGTAGKILGDNLNATVSSRSSHSAADVWTSGTRTLTSFGTLVSDIWSNATRTLSAFGFTVTTDVSSTVTTNLDDTVSSRASQSSLNTAISYIDTEVAAIKAKTDNLPASPASTSDIQTGVDAALDAAQTAITAVPSNTGTLRNMIKFIAAYLRNRRAVDSNTGTETLYREDATTSLGSATYTDSGTVLDKGEMN